MTPVFLTILLFLQKFHLIGKSNGSSEIVHESTVVVVADDEGVAVSDASFLWNVLVVDDEGVLMGNFGPDLLVGTVAVDGIVSCESDSRPTEIRLSSSLNLIFLLFLHLAH